MKCAVNFVFLSLIIFVQVLSAQVPQAQPAPEWDALFDRTSGWTGADGIYSIPISGKDSPGSAGSTKTLFVFSDTFVGSVGADNKRLSGTKLVNNTMAVLQGGDPAPSKITFLVRKNGSSNPVAYFVPSTPNTQPGDWYWLGDGISLNGKVHIFALRMKKETAVFSISLSAELRSFHSP